MHHISLLPIFCIVILLNFILLSMSILNEVKYRKYQMGVRFYPNLVLFFIWWAYLTRGTFLIYIVSEYPYTHFNRFMNDQYGDMYWAYLEQFPNMFYCLASVTYLIKWVSEYYAVPVNSNYDEKYAERAQIITRWSTIAISIVTVLIFIISQQTHMDKTAFRIFVSVLFFATWIGLQITSRRFLSQLKKYVYDEYENRGRGVRIITLVATILIFLKGFSVLAAFLHYNFYDIENITNIEVHTAFDILLIVNYFIESMPSMIMFVVRFRQLREYASFSILKHQKTEGDSTNTSRCSINYYKLSHMQTQGLVRSKDNITLNSHSTGQSKNLRAHKTINEDEFTILYDDRNRAFTAIS